jgi:ribonucleoside-diphosphate reductase alpha chain
VGGLLMASGLSYDSDKGRALIGAITALMTGESYVTSAEMSGELGAFPGFPANKDGMLRVIRNHRRAAYGLTSGYEGLATNPVPLDAENCPDAALVAAARVAWDNALTLGEKHGFRNAQATVVAPTGTIGLVMDCDTTGIEPDFALVKFKKLAGGGYFKIINRMVPEALRNLGYSENDVAEMIRYAVGHATLSVSRPRVSTKPRWNGWNKAWKRPSTSSSCSTNTPWAPISASTSWAFRPPSWTICPSTCWPISASPRPRSTPPTPIAAAP